MLSRIHVNQHIIRSNAKRGTQTPPLTVKSYKANRKATEADILVDGVVLATVVYRPENPLPCGAKCWVETGCQVETR